MKIKNVTEKDFKHEIEHSQIPVVVDFYASWCGPCQKLSGVMDELAEEYNGSVNFIKVNVEDEKALSETYSIVSIPTLITFKDGKSSNRKSGFESKEDIVDFIETALEI